MNLQTVWHIVNSICLTAGLLLPVSVQAQTPAELRGFVTDPHGEPLVFVTILLNDDRNRGVLTDIEGRFSIPAGTQVRSLTFRYVGYDSLRLEKGEWQEGTILSVVLQPKEASLEEVVIRAGENPADRIIRLAIANRHRHDPDKLRSYQCQTYNKFTFQLIPDSTAFRSWAATKDTSRKEWVNLHLEFDTLVMAERERYLFLMETVTRRSYKSPDLVQEEVLLNRASGLSESSLVALSNAVQPFSFYEEYLRIIDKQFLNPLSPGSLDKYFFAIEDTLFYGLDSIYILSFHPRQGKSFEGLKGVLHISTNGYALANVRASPAEPLNMDLVIEQQYQWLPEAAHWFPDQLNFEVFFPKYPGDYLGTRIMGRSFISDVVVSPDLKLGVFDPEMPLIILPGAATRSDSLWHTYHSRSPLSAKEVRTYVFMDSLGREENFDWLGKLTDIAATGQLRIKGILSLDLKRIIALNPYENIRLGLGLTTANPLPLRRGRRFDISAYAGYGLRDKTWKYGGELTFRWFRNEQHTARISYQNHYLEPGALHELFGTSLVDRSLYTRFMDRNREWSVQVRNRIMRGVYTRIWASRQTLTPQYRYAYGSADADTLRSYHFAETGVALRIALNHDNPSIFGQALPSDTRLPVVDFSYIIGWPSVLNGQFAYQKWIGAVEQTFHLWRAGRLSYRLEAGYIQGDIPFFKLFTLNQSGAGGSSWLYVGNTFQTTEDSLFWLSDRFINGYFSHRFGRIFQIADFCQPELSLLQQVSVGRLSRPDLHQYLDFKTAQSPLLESGIRLDNLLLLNYVDFAYLGLGGVVLYRWGTHAYPEWTKNISFRLSVKLNL